MEAEAFPDAGTKSERITVKRARSFIINFYLGKERGEKLSSEDLDRNVYEPYLATTGVTIDEKYEDIMKKNDILNDKALISAGKFTEKRDGGNLPKGAPGAPGLQKWLNITNIFIGVLQPDSKVVIYKPLYNLYKKLGIIKDKGESRPVSSTTLLYSPLVRRKETGSKEDSDEVLSEEYVKVSFKKVLSKLLRTTLTDSKRLIPVPFIAIGLILSLWQVSYANMMLSQNHAVNLNSAPLKEDKNEAISRFIQVGLNKNDIKDGKVTLDKLQQILNSNNNLKKIAEKLFVKNIGENQWQITPVKTKDNFPLLSVKPSANDVVSVKYLRSLKTSGAELDPSDMDTYCSVADSYFKEGTDIYNSATSISVNTPPLYLKGHNDPIEILKMIKALKELLPLEYYFDKHSIGSDNITNASSVKHIDFESKGRGDLNFKLERIYSSFNVFSQKGEYILNQNIKPYYEYLRDVLDSVEKTTRDSLFESFSPIFIFYDTQHMVWDGGPNSIETLHYVAMVVLTLIDPTAPDALEQLYNTYKNICETGGYYGDNEPLAGIDNNNRLFWPYKWHTPSGGWDWWPHWYEGPRENNVIVDPAQPVRYGNALPTALDYMWDIWQKCKTGLDEYTKQVNIALENIEKVEKENIYQEPVLGDGWCFNTPFIEPPITRVEENGIVTVVRSGMIFFDGYRKRTFENMAYKQIREEKAVFKVLNSDEVPKIEGNTINLNNGRYIKFRIEQNQNYYYFDDLGRLMFITDYTHNNAIKFTYSSDNDDLKSCKDIKKIVDAAGNQYEFDRVIGKQSEGATFGYVYPLLLLTVTAKDEKGIEYKKVEYRVRKEREISASALYDLDSWENNHANCVLEKVEEINLNAWNHITTYSYEDWKVFDGLVPHYIPEYGGEVTFESQPREINLSFLVSETNPINGVVNFEYYVPDYKEQGISLMPGLPIWERNTDETGQIVDLIKYKIRTHLDVDKQFRSGKVEIAHAPILEWQSYRDQDNYVINNQSLGYDTFILSDQQVKEAEKLLRPLSKWKQTVTLKEDSIEENIYKYDKRLGKWNLKKNTIFSVPGWKKPVQTSWVPCTFEEFINGGYHEKSLKDVLGEVLQTKIYDYDDYGNVLTIKTVTGNPILGDIADAVVQEYSYLAPLQKFYGLPGKVVTRSENNEIVKTVNYDYHPLFHQKITGIGGDTKSVSFRYEYPIEQDPAHCRKPTIVTERGIQTGDIETRYWYDKYGNLKKTRNAMGHEVTYNYENVDMVGGGTFEQRFLHEIIRNHNGADIVQTLNYNNTGKLSGVKDSKGNQTSYTYDGYGRVKTVDFPDGGQIVYIYSDEPHSWLAKNTTRIKRKVNVKPEQYYETDIVSDEHGNLIRIIEYYYEKPQGITSVGGVVNGIIDLSNTVLGGLGLDLPPTSTKKANITEIKRDGLNRVEYIIRNDDAWINFQYDPLGRYRKIIDFRGGITNISYDDILKYRPVVPSQSWKLTRMRIVTDPVGNEKVYYYDALGQLRYVKMKNVETNYGQSTEDVFWQYGYDERGRLTEILDPYIVKTIFMYDDLNRLIGRRVEKGGESIESTYRYNDIHQPFRYIDPKGNTIGYEYDDLDRLEYIQMPDKNTITFGYDDNSNMNSVDHNGRRTSYNYDSLNRLNFVQYPEGNIFTQGYNLLGRLTSQTAKTSQGDFVQNWDYDYRNRLMSYEDAHKLGESGNIWQWGYNQYNGLEWSIEPRGDITKKTYTTNKAGDVLTVKDAKGNVIEFVRDDLGRVRRKIVHALNIQFSYDYNTFGKIKWRMSPDGSVWRYSSDKVGRLIQIRTPEGRTLNTEYDFLSRIFKWYKGTDEEIFTFSYDNNGNVGRVESGYGKITEYMYDPLNRLTNVIPFGNPSLTDYVSQTGKRAQKVITYEDLGNKGIKETVTNEMGHVVIYEKDGNGRIRKISDYAKSPEPGDPEPRYRITVVSYNELGRIETFQRYLGKINDPVPADPLRVYIENYDYYPNGGLKNIKYGNGEEVDYEFDPNGNTKKIITKTSDGRRFRTDLIYADVHDLPTTVIGPEGFPRKIRYDALGRQILTDEFGGPVAIGYDDIHRQVIYALPSGRKYVHTYNKDGLIGKIQKPDTKYPPSVFKYDSAGRLWLVRNSLKDEFKYGYNKMGQFEQMRYKKRGTTNYLPVQKKTDYNTDGTVKNVGDISVTYDQSGNVVESEDSINSTKYQYNIDGTLAKIRYHDGAWVEYYYENGLFDSIWYSNGLKKYLEHDHNRNVVKITERKTGEQDKTVRYERDELGRVIKEFVDEKPNAEIRYLMDNVIKKINGIEYVYDEITGQLKKIMIEKNPKSADFCMTYEYYPNGWLKARKTAQGFYQTLSYDDDGRIKSIETNTVLYNVIYDFNGNPCEVIKVNKITKDTEKHDYLYNGEDWLIVIDYKTGQEIVYDYDENGNLIYEHKEKQNETIKRIFDSNNQLEKQIVTPGLTSTFSYDARGNLTFIDQIKRGNDIVKNISLTYDGNHRLIKIDENIKGVNNTEHVEYDAADRISRAQYKGKIQNLRHADIYPTQLDDKSIIPDIDNLRPLGFVKQKSIFIPTYLSGNSEVIEDEKGKLLGQQTQLPYGDNFSGNYDMNPFGYKGYFQILGSDNIQWAFSRMYSPLIKHFLSPDILPGTPFDSMSMNRRRVFRNSPLRYVDVLGLEESSEPVYAGEIPGYDPAAYTTTVRAERIPSYDPAAYTTTVRAERIPIFLGNIDREPPNINIPDISPPQIPSITLPEIPRFEGSAWGITLAPFFPPESESNKIFNPKPKVPAFSNLPKTKLEFSDKEGTIFEYTSRDVRDIIERNIQNIQSPLPNPLRSDPLVDNPQIPQIVPAIMEPNYNRDVLRNKADPEKIFQRVERSVLLLSYLLTGAFGIPGLLNSSELIWSILLTRSAHSVGEFIEGEGIPYKIYDLTINTYGEAEKNRIRKMIKQIERGNQPSWVQGYPTDRYNEVQQ